MDKNTLSNYGWIVVCILVISVMLALATPFGRFIADGFKATYEGFGLVTDKAFAVVGLGNGGSGGGEQGGTETPDEPTVQDKHLYRFEFMLSSDESNYSWVLFDVMESDPTKAYLGAFTPYDEASDDGWNGYIAYSNNCSCSPDGTGINDENAQGFTFDLANGSVTCPCGATTFTNANTQDFTCEHTNGNFSVNYFTAENHELICQDCGNWLYPVIEAHKDENSDNACDVCGYTDPAVCEHINGQYWKQLNGTHNFNCNTCKTNQEGLTCNMVDGTCTFCGYTDPANCSHTQTDGINLWDGTHNVECNSCGTLVAEGEAHNDGDSDGYCDACWEYLGGEIIGGGTGGCEHNSGNTWISNQQDGTHATVCGDCFTMLNETKEVHYDNDTDGTCDVCGACVTHIDNDSDGFCDRDVVPMN